jgi:hypothetical protein
MNNTKWDELRCSMHELPRRPRWRIRDVGTGHESAWDGDWYYHFRVGGYRSIEWVEIEATSPEELAALQAILARIHVPGTRSEFGFKIFGHIRPGLSVDYVSAA